MRRQKLKPLTLLVLSAIGLTLSTTTFAGDLTKRDTIVIHAKHDISMPLASIPGNKMTGSLQNQIQSVIKTGLVTIKAFQGMGMGLAGYTVSAASPDLAGAIGIDQFVQWVDPDIAVFDKTTGAVLPGFPKPGNAIWLGFGGPCETSNVGDPKVKFDQLANRWVITRQAYDDINNGPFYQCVAVSTTKNATDAWYRYAFQMDSLNNYGTLGLWPDGYYVAMLMLGPVSNGPRACAFERDKMLMGLPASAQCKQLSNDESGVMRPVDLGGKLLPPPDASARFFSLNPPNGLLFFKFATDWSNSGNTQLSVETLPVPTFSKPCPDTGGTACIVQPDTTNRLDVIGDRFTSRIVYHQFPENIGSYIAIHNVEGAEPKFSTAIRWYEFRIKTDDPLSTPVIYQYGTLQPDSKARFNGSVGIDIYHNIAMGYTVSSTAVHPSPELAYRNYFDTLNSLTVQAMYTGHGSELDNIWSRFSQMSVDPIDSCTFWFTGEYLDTSGIMNWSTAITNFKLAAC